QLQGFIGTGGGVITINSAFGSTGHAGFLDVKLGPASAIRLGGAWRVSPTNSGEKGELKYYTNYMAASKMIAVQSTNFSVEVKNLSGFNMPPTQTAQVTANNTTTLNLMYSVLPPLLTFGRVSGLGILGTPGTAYRVESTPILGNTNWTAVTNITLLSGTNVV